MFNPSTVILFTPIALTSVYLAYLAYQHEIRLWIRIIELQKHLARSNTKLKHSMYTASQEWYMKEMAEGTENRFKEAVRRFYFTRAGGFIILAFIMLSGFIGLVIGLGLAFINNETALQVGGIPIIIIITYIMLVLLSDILVTVNFAKNMKSINTAKLGTKDLKVFKRAASILSVRKRQFLVIAALLFFYGIAGGLFDALFIFVLTVESEVPEPGHSGKCGC